MHDVLIGWTLAALAISWAVSALWWLALATSEPDDLQAGGGHTASYIPTSVSQEPLGSLSQGHHR